MANKLILPLVALCISLTLSGCIEKLVRDPYPVTVPVMIAPPATERPTLAIDAILNEPLTPEEKGEAIKAYVQSAEAIRQYAIELEKILEQYAVWSNEVAIVRKEMETLMEEVRARNAELLEDNK